MLLLACEEGCAEEAMIISAMLSVERVFYSFDSSPLIHRLSSNDLHHDRGKRLQRKQQRFVSELGDHFTYLNVYVFSLCFIPGL